MTTEYARSVFEKEVETARSYLEKFAVHSELAQTLSRKYGFELPLWTETISDSPVSEARLSPTGEGGPDTQSPVTEEEPSSTAADGRSVPDAPSMPQMILNYFEAHDYVAEPKTVDAWVRREYPAAGVKDYGIGQTMSRMTSEKDGRLYSKRYPDQQSSSYGLPEWALPGDDPERGFKPEHLTRSLREHLATVEGFNFSERNREERD